MDENINIRTIISRYGNEGYKHLIDTLAYICNTGRFNTYYFLDEYKVTTWISSILPASKEGYVLENIDLILRIYDKSDDIGKFKLIEFKHTTNITSNAVSRLGRAQELTFGLIDRMLNSSTYKDRYEGFYLIKVDPSNNIIVNNVTLTQEEFKAFLLGKLKVEPYRFELEYHL